MVSDKTGVPIRAVCWALKRLPSFSLAGLIHVDCIYKNISMGLNPTELSGIYFSFAASDSYYKSHELRKRLVNWAPLLLTATVRKVLSSDFLFPVHF